MIEGLVQPLQLSEGRLTGSGAELLLREAGASQFVMIAESHNDAVTPRFTSALFGHLSREAGYQYLALEQDPYGMEAAGARPLRGALRAIIDHARRHPFQYTFITDEELAMVADAGRISRARERPVWGVDQVYGAALPLEELERRAPTPAARAATRALLTEVRSAERLTPDPSTGAPARRIKGVSLGQRAQALLPRFRELRAVFGSHATGRAGELIDALETSARIYDHNRRAGSEPVGLHANVEREAGMKARFLREYRAAERRDRRPPRVVYKAGSFHVVRGLTSVGVFTLGGFLHEFATANGSGAVSLQLIPMGTWYAKPEDLPLEYRVLHPSGDLTRGSIVDLRPLRAHLHGGETFGLKTAKERADFRALIFSHDFMAFLPSQEAGRALVGPTLYD